VITPKEIEAVVATMARIPPKSVSTDDKRVLENLEADLKRVVFGQDLAIEKLASAIKLSRAGLRDPDKPIGNYLFSGPTGVGKTEVARQLASIMGIPLQRFDMSEYMERHSVSRLIGAPPGYVGYDQGGLLTDAVDQQPHSVLLLDEIEKAHPDLFNILLQVMDNGKLTDHHGKTVDFRNTILIMTTNAGASDMARESIGFGAMSREDVQEDAVKKMFTPEFRNRLDAIVPFGYLPPAVVARVVDKFILQLELQLADRGVHIDLDDEAREWLTAGLRQALRRPPDGPPGAGEDQAAAGRGIAVRQAGQRRRGQGPDQGQCPGVRDHPGARQRPLVFAGYGVQAPERQWDDFKGQDVRGKILVVLINDPDFEGGEGSPDFGGKAMTYYGRWTYKYEEAAKLGAAGVMIVHEDRARLLRLGDGQELQHQHHVRHRPRRTRPPSTRRWKAGSSATRRALFRAPASTSKQAKAGRQAPRLPPIDFPRRFSASGTPSPTITSYNVAGHAAGQDAPGRDGDLHRAPRPSRHRPARRQRRPHLQWRARQCDGHRPRDRAGARLRPRARAPSARSCSCSSAPRRRACSAPNITSPTRSTRWQDGRRAQHRRRASTAGARLLHLGHGQARPARHADRRRRASRAAPSRPTSGPRPATSSAPTISPSPSAAFRRSAGGRATTW
jgi:hypothetical protein